jgi:hypothetical protein
VGIGASGVFRRATMPKPVAVPSDRTDAPPPCHSTAVQSAPGGGGALLTAEQLSRQAEQVAGGEAPIPVGLSPAEFLELVRQVRRRRHDRLVRFLVGVIADDLHRGDR